MESGEMSRTGLFPAIFWAVAATGCATPMPVTPEAMRAAECMAEVLKSSPDAKDIGTRVLWDHEGLKPIVEYTFPDNSSIRRPVRLWVTTDPWDGARHVFEISTGYVPWADPANIVKNWDGYCYVAPYPMVLITE
jgi:hypothetical protein